MPKISAKFEGVTPNGSHEKRWVGSDRRFSTNISHRYISETMQDRDIVTKER